MTTYNIVSYFRFVQIPPLKSYRPYYKLSIRHVWNPPRFSPAYVIKIFPTDTTVTSKTAQTKKYLSILSGTELTGMNIHNQ